MKIACIGAIDGDFAIYEKLKEHSLDWVLCTGDYGVWPDATKLDRATRLKNPNQTFNKIHSIPIPTLFVSGVHEDHEWLHNQYLNKNSRVKENSFWLANGFKTNIGDLDNVIRVTGFGKVYSEKTYKGEYHKKSKRHYTRNELQRGCSSGPTEILLLHDSPDSPGIRNLIFATRPKLILHSSKKFNKQTIQQTPCYGLKSKQIIFFEYKDKMFNCLNDQ